MMAGMVRDIGPSVGRPSGFPSGQTCLVGDNRRLDTVIGMELDQGGAYMALTVPSTRCSRRAI